ncbi:hypothetical protein C882_1030 [Caenispirillum salinarum AK4]|uniref:HTH merR-type domain-containing protein n=1 Tax=Caenispirillum salinarum AK4 TaxID=1238182 RepID=K9HIL3_9PROT|nr:MerR family transcriptional regulator [Caenispirillum salinarum]EKV28456.1 hypothetical protein C882_1030 [Caenispirillum salinarum AK4]
MIADPDRPLTEDEVLERVAGLTRAMLHRWLHTGAVRPARIQGLPGYREADVARLELIVTLTEDFDVADDEALEVVLSLLDQLHGLRRELLCLARAVDHQPPAVRHAILEEVRRLRGQD